jgi:RNase P subunit RPR2
MTEIRFNPNTPSTIERPRCPNCTCRMMPARNRAASSKDDLRSFECATCGHVIKALVAEDPMQSKSAGWLDANLRAPN